jgi:trans-aconitate methyltransferase
MTTDTKDETAQELTFPMRDKLKFLFELDTKWFLPSMTKPDDIRLGYVPYQLPDFISIMSEVTREAEGNKFLDVGSGPGVKMSIAHQLYGYHVTGLESNFDMCVDAAQANAADSEADIWCDDPLEAPDGFYAPFDVIWLSRPFRSLAHEKELEARIMEEMRPGAILASGDWATEMPESAWTLVLDDFEVRRGAWKRPVG